MRRTFATELHQQMEKDERIWLVTADLGFGMWDKIRDDFPDRFINTGASEQSCADICVGLALNAQIPFMYTITPFYYRCFETLRTYIDHESINVKLLGAGRNRDYHIDGFSHDASDIHDFLYAFRNITEHYPKTKEEIPQLLSDILKSDKPCFLSLTR